MLREKVGPKCPWACNKCSYYCRGNLVIWIETWSRREGWHTAPVLGRVFFSSRRPIPLSFYSDDCDAIIWCFDNSSKFSVQSMYNTVVTFRGIQPVYTPVIWNLYVPPRVHIFLWLISNDKILTRANLAKRRTLEDLSCLLCPDPETTHHLFF